MGAVLRREEEFKKGNAKREILNPKQYRN
jgi:hypothetical protein